MPDAQLGDLAGPARRGVLVTFAARLRVVQRAEALVDGLDFVEGLLVGRAGGVVDEAVTVVVETCRRLLRLSSRGNRGRCLLRLLSDDDRGNPKKREHPDVSHD